MESSKVQLSGLQIVLAKTTVILKLSSQGWSLLWMTSNVLFLIRINNTSSLFHSCPSVPLISALPKGDMLKTLIVIRLPKNGKAMERDPETLVSPCKGAALTAGESRGLVTWGLVLIVPGLSVILPADTEMRAIPLLPPKAQSLWPSSSLPRDSTAEIPAAISLEVSIMEEHGF